jgi:aspartate--ammonia ligase
MSDKTADLAGPGIGTYEEVEEILSKDYEPLLTPKDRMKALFKVKNYIEENLCKELNLFMIQVPLIVDQESGVNDFLDRDGARTPIEFPCRLGLEKRIQAQVVQAATKWKRMALQQFLCHVGEGVCTDMKAVRKDYFLDHDHSSYVDQWDGEQVITKDMRNLGYLTTSLHRSGKLFTRPDKWLRKTFQSSIRPNIRIFQRNWSSSTRKKSLSAIRTYPDVIPLSIGGGIGQSRTHMYLLRTA